MDSKQSSWFKPLLFIASAAFVAALIAFGADLPPELSIVMFILSLVGARNALRSR